MSEIEYHIVEHDGGWAYKLGDVFSEPYPTHDAARAAAELAAAEQKQPGETDVIEYQDQGGQWRTETGQSEDRPDVKVVD